MVEAHAVSIPRLYSLATIADSATPRSIFTGAIYMRAPPHYPTLTP
jgi:hypothetical protein